MTARIQAGIGLALLLAAMAACASSSGRMLELAKSRWREGNYDDALRLNTLLYERDREGGYAAQALLNNGDIYYLNLRQLREAIETYTKVAEEFPGTRQEITARQQLVKIYVNEVRDLTQAIEEYDKLLGNPGVENRPELMYQRANARFNNGDYDGAFRELRRLQETGISLHLADQVCLKIGNIYQIQKKFDRAAEMFQKVTESPCMECRRRALLHLSESYEALFNFDKAIATLRKLDDTRDAELARNEINRLVKKRQVVGSGTTLSWEIRRK